MAGGQSLHVLVVDDDPHMREIAKVALELDDRITVSTCDSGEAALIAAPGLEPNVILLDLMLPQMDGVATMMRLREHAALAAVPVVICSATVHRDETERLLALGAALVIAKPFDFQNLRHLVRQIWEKSRTDRARAAEERIGLLRQDFRRRLFAEHAALTACLAASDLRGTLTASEMVSVRDLAHKLAGAGGTFGYVEVSRAAADCQTLADEALSRPELDAPSAKLTAALGDLIAALEAALKQEV